MSLSRSRLVTVSIAAVTGAGILAVVHHAMPDRETPTGHDPKPSTAPSSSATPLPDEFKTIADIWTMASKQAAAWESDARVVRLYADNVGPDGAIVRGTSVVQIVFLSPTRSVSPARGVRNGIRFVVDKAGVTTSQIVQFPAPIMEGPSPTLCDLSALAGAGAPAQFTVDADFTPKGDTARLSMFTRDRSWLVVADALRCAVRGRSTDKTAQEDRVQSDAGPAFDEADAGRQLMAILKRASECHRGDSAATPGAVTVTFRADGKVDQVRFVRGIEDGSPSADCLSTRLKKMSVKPWMLGSGSVSQRFVM